MATFDVSRHPTRSRRLYLAWLIWCWCCFMESLLCPSSLSRDDPSFTMSGAGNATVLQSRSDRDEKVAQLHSITGATVPIATCWDILQSVNWDMESAVARCLGEDTEQHTDASIDGTRASRTCKAAAARRDEGAPASEKSDASRHAASTAPSTAETSDVDDVDSPSAASALRTALTRWAHVLQTLASDAAPAEPIPQCIQDVVRQCVRRFLLLTTAATASEGGERDDATLARLGCVLRAALISPCDYAHNPQVGAEHDDAMKASSALSPEKPPPNSRPAVAALDISFIDHLTARLGALHSLMPAAAGQRSPRHGTKPVLECKDLQEVKRITRDLADLTAQAVAGCCGGSYGAAVSKFDGPTEPTAAGGPQDTAGPSHVDNAAQDRGMQMETEEPEPWSWALGHPPGVPDRLTTPDATAAAEGGVPFFSGVDSHNSHASAAFTDEALTSLARWTEYRCDTALHLTQSARRSLARFTDSKSADDNARHVFHAVEERIDERHSNIRDKLQSARARSVELAFQLTALGTLEATIDECHREQQLTISHHLEQMAKEKVALQLRINSLVRRQTRLRLTQKAADERHELLKQEFARDVARTKQSLAQERQIGVAWAQCDVMVKGCRGIVAGVTREVSAIYSTSVKLLERGVMADAFRAGTHTFDAIRRGVRLLEVLRRGYDVIGGHVPTHSALFRTASSTTLLESGVDEGDSGGPPQATHHHLVTTPCTVVPSDAADIAGVLERIVQTAIRHAHEVSYVVSECNQLLDQCDRESLTLAGKGSVTVLSPKMIDDFCEVLIKEVENLKDLHKTRRCMATLPAVIAAPQSTIVGHVAATGHDTAAPTSSVARGLAGMPSKLLARPRGGPGRAKVVLPTQQRGQGPKASGSSVFSPSDDLPQDRDRAGLAPPPPPSISNATAITTSSQRAATFVRAFVNTYASVGSEPSTA